MNTVVLSGKIQNNAITRGKQNNVLLFTLAATHNGGGNGNGNSDETKESVSFVPCVMFNPPPDVQQKLTKEGKGLLCELQGRVNTSRYEADGQVKYNTEVVVYTKTFQVMN